MGDLCLCFVDFPYCHKCIFAANFCTLLSDISLLFFIIDADLDIGKDFFTSWKSMADGDAMDFDLTSASKGNKKPFNFDKV